MRPVRDAFNEAERDCSMLENEFETRKAEYDRSELALQKIKSDNARAKAEADAAAENVQRSKTRLRLSQRLVRVLLHEKKGWKNALVQRTSDMRTLVGDCLLASAVAMYAGPFESSNRSRIVREKWVSWLIEKEISFNATTDVTLTLLTASERHRLLLETLPADGACMEHVAIATTCEFVRWPYFVDPHGEIIEWLRCRYGDKKAEEKVSWIEIDAQASGVHQMITQQVEDGGVVLLRGLKSVDSDETTRDLLQWMRPLLARDVRQKQGGSEIVRLGSNEYTLSPRFKMYLVTSAAAPRLPDFVFTCCNVVHSALNTRGVHMQLLSMVSRIERPDLAERRSSMSRQLASWNISQEETWTKILRGVTDNADEISEDEELTVKLETVKAEKNEFDRQINSASADMALVDSGIDKFRALATRATLMYKLSSRLSRMDASCVYSLNSFAVMFHRALEIGRAEIKARGGLQSILLKGDANSDDDSDEETDSQEYEVDIGPISTLSFRWSESLLRLCRLPTPEGQRPVLYSTKGFGSVGRVPTDSEAATLCRIYVPKITRVLFDWLRMGLQERYRPAAVLALCLELLREDRDEADLVTRELAFIFDNFPQRQSTLSPPQLASETSGKAKDSKSTENEEREEMSKISDALKTWMTEGQWSAMCAMSKHFSWLDNLPTNLQDLSEEWEDWTRLEAPERAPVPEEDVLFGEECLEFQGILRRSMFVKILRPDRLTAALEWFAEERLGTAYVSKPPPFDIRRVYQASTIATPLFFRQSSTEAEDDAVRLIEALAAEQEFTVENGKLSIIAMGQQQSFQAERSIMRLSLEGGWVVLTSLHLLRQNMPRNRLETRIRDAISNPKTHKDFRCFLVSRCAETDKTAATSPQLSELLLRNALKISNAPSIKMKVLVRHIWSRVSTTQITSSTRPSELKLFAFCLCVFHAHLLSSREILREETWSDANALRRVDSSDFALCLRLGQQLIEACPEGAEFPWAGLRFIVACIVYGSHVTSSVDQRIIDSRLEGADAHGLLAASVLSGAELFPGFNAPNASAMSMDEIVRYIETDFPSRLTSRMFGTHPRSMCRDATRTLEMLMGGLRRLINDDEFIVLVTPTQSVKASDSDEVMDSTNIDEASKAIEEDIPSDSSDDDDDDDDDALKSDIGNGAKESDVETKEENDSEKDKEVEIDPLMGPEDVMLRYRNRAKEAVASLYDRIPALSMTEFWAFRRRALRFLHGMKPEEEEGKEKEEKEEANKDDEKNAKSREDDETSEMSESKKMESSEEEWSSDDEREGDGVRSKNETDDDLLLMSDSDDEDAADARAMEAHLRGPFVVCLIREMHRMSCLLDQMRTSLQEAKLALSGAKSMRVNVAELI
eukprot:g3390.t1